MKTGLEGLEAWHRNAVITRVVLGEVIERRRVDVIRAGERGLATYLTEELAKVTPVDLPTGHPFRSETTPACLVRVLDWLRHVGPCGGRYDLGTVSWLFDEFEDAIERYKSEPYDPISGLYEDAKSVTEAYYSEYASWHGRPIIFQMRHVGQRPPHLDLDHPQARTFSRSASEPIVIELQICLPVFTCETYFASLYTLLHELVCHAGRGVPELSNHHSVFSEGWMDVVAAYLFNDVASSSPYSGRGHRTAGWAIHRARYNAAHETTTYAYEFAARAMGKRAAEGVNLWMDRNEFLRRSARLNAGAHPAERLDAFVVAVDGLLRSGVHGVELIARVRRLYSSLAK